MANEEGALYVDTYSAFMRQPNLRDLFADHIHPNEVGHQRAPARRPRTGSLVDKVRARRARQPGSWFEAATCPYQEP
jgi:hypothetical protein